MANENSLWRTETMQNIHGYILHWTKSSKFIIHCLQTKQIPLPNFHALKSLG